MIPASKRECLRVLWKETFGDSEEYLTLIFDNLYDDAFSLVCSPNGEILKNWKASPSITEQQNIAAGLIGIPYQFKSSASGTMFRGLYLCGLATRPQFRKHGLMGRLLQEIEEMAALANFDFLFLIPADDHLRHYYEKAGFESSFDRCRLSLNGQEMALFADQTESELVSGEPEDSLLPTYSPDYLELARKELILSGGKVIQDPMSSSEVFVDGSNEPDSARVRYFSATSPGGIFRLLTILRQRYERLEFLLPACSPVMKALTSSTNKRAICEPYAMIKPIYENRKFANETSTFLKKRILADTRKYTWLMMD